MVHLMPDSPSSSIDFPWLIPPTFVRLQRSTMPLLQTPLRKGRWPVSSEDLLGRCLGNTVREREADTLLEQLLEVRALDVGGLLNLNNLEDLDDTVSIQLRPATRWATYVD